MGTDHSLTSDAVLPQPVMIIDQWCLQKLKKVLLKIWLLIRTWDCPRSLDVSLEEFCRGRHIQLRARLPFAWKLSLILGNCIDDIISDIGKLSGLYGEIILQLSWWSRFHLPLLGMNSLTHSPLAAAISLQRIDLRLFWYRSIQIITSSSHKSITIS